MTDTPRPAHGIVNSTAAAAVNHLLRSAGWARAELQQHAGKTVCCDLFPFMVSLTVLDDGTVVPAAVEALPEATVRLTPGLMLRLAAHDESAWHEVDVGGDTALAASIGRLARHLRWDFEEDLSRVFGDIAAHRMAGSARTLERWGRESADGIARSLAEYWTEERPLIAARRDVAEFNREVDELRDDVARLEKRIALAMRAAAP